MFHVTCVFEGGPKMVGFPNNHGFPTKNDYLGVFRGYHHLRKHPLRGKIGVFIALADLSFPRWYANLSYGLGPLLLVCSFCTLVPSLGRALYGPKRSPSNLLLSRDIFRIGWDR